MKLDVAVHQLSTSYLQALIGPSDEAPHPDHVDPQDCIGGILGKVLDGTDWMTSFDLHPRAIDGLDAIRQRVRDHAAKGREWFPWANVRGHNASQEGAMAAEIALVVRDAEIDSHDSPAVFIANVEPYPQFWPWRGQESSNRASQYIAAFKYGGGEELRLWVDARDWQLTQDRGIGLSQWVRQAVSYGVRLRVMPEIYWTDFNRAPAVAIDNAREVLASFGFAPEDILPTFPGDATPNGMTWAIRRAHELGWGRPNIWQRLNLREDTAIAIAKQEDLWAPTPPTTVEVPLEIIRQLLSRTAAASVELGLLSDSRADISWRLDEVRAKVEDTIGQLERLTTSE